MAKGKDTTPFQAKEITGVDYEKMGTLTTSSSKDNLLIENKTIRRLTPRECGRLQSIPEDKLEILLNCGISDSQLYKMFGNGWNIKVISHILQYLKISNNN